MSERSRSHPLTRMLIVIGVLAVLATLIFPLIGMLDRRRSKAQPGEDLRALAHAMGDYVADQGGRWPSARPVGTRVESDAWRTACLEGLSVLAAWDTTRPIARLVERSALGMGGPAPVAWDWSVPAAAHADRPLIGQRDPDLWSGAGIHIVTVAGHGEFVSTTRGQAETPPDDASDPPLPWSVPYEGDDLFTRTGDGPGMDVVGGGSATRCFLK